MAEQLSGIHHLYKYNDGDNIDARMGVYWTEPGYGLTQYYNESAGTINTDFTQHSPILYPFPYSSKRGQYVVPATQGQQWYYNNPDTETAGILDENGNVKSAYSSLFEVTTHTVNNAIYPALRIKGNLCSANDLTDKYIYYRSTYNGKPFTCVQKITVQTTIGDAKEILISLTTYDGSGSNVLSNTNSWIQMTALLQRGGSNIAGATYQWQKLVNGTWTPITTSQQGVIEIISQNTIKVYDPGVESEDIFRVAVTHDGVTGYKTQQLTDTSDVYYIFDGCSQAGDAVAEGVNVSFTPVVYERSTQSPDSKYTWHFTFRLLNLVTGATVGSPSTTVPYMVPYSTLEAEGGVTVVISATNQ